jgi:hypothetical protein
MRRKSLLWVLFGIIVVFYAATVRPGNRWGDDFALYILHAQNIVRGRPYATTGYIYNSAAPQYSPSIYPPVFPLLLAPIDRFLGLNFLAMKLEQSAFLLLALVAMYFYWRRDLSFPYLLALIAIVAFNPTFWDAKDNVLSDLPFLLFFYLAVLLAQFSPRDRKGSWAWALLTGFSLYLCAGTRGIGLTLLPGLVLYDLLKRRRVTLFTAIAIASAAAFLLAQRLIIGPGLSSYADQFHPTLPQLAHNLVSYSHSLGTFWLDRDHRPFSAALYIFIMILALAGAWFHARRGVTIVETFLAPYLCLVLLWPAEKGMLRFLFPLVPFVVYLVLLALQNLTAGWPPLQARTACAAFVLLIGVSYVLAYAHTDFGPIPETNGSPAFAALCTQIREHTGEHDVFIYRRARALALFTSRSAATYAPNVDAAFGSYAQQIHATYLVTSNEFPEDREFLIPWVKKNPTALIPIYHNQNFDLYQLRLHPDQATEAQSREAAQHYSPER